MPRLRSTALALVVTLVTLHAPSARTAEADAIAWRDWSPEVFTQARAEGRLVLLDLGAVWCHWCHVMHETTYRDPEVVRLLKAHFVAVEVDQDARPDLSNRYEDYGWPATIIFAADGSELVKFQGYVTPRRMAALLQGVVDDPTPGPSVSAPPRAELTGGDSGVLPEGLRDELLGLLSARYDERQGGWGFTHKYLDWDALEYSLYQARLGDAQAESRARQTLARQQKLIDPVWGGVYQYSDSGDWEHPHFEKIMSHQAENLRIYALAYAQWGAPEHLRAARDVERFLDAFLSAPDGTFHVSMDADVVRGEHAGDYFALDDAGRRARGLPRVDRHRYARENAWAALGLLALHAQTGEERLLERALRVGRFLLEERARQGGGFDHDERDETGPYLGDNVAAARLFLALYTATGERAWLGHVRSTLAFIARAFRRAGVAGFVTSAAPGALLAPMPQRDENVALARVANLAFHFTGETSLRELAREALRHLAIPEVARRPQTGGVLLAADELGREPLHVTVVGPREDAAARALLRAALALPEASYARIELWDRREGPLPRADVTYPELKRPAAFVCTASRCSAPAFSADELRRRVRRVPGS